MTQSPLALANLSSTELLRLRDELKAVNTALIRQQKLLAPQFAAINAALRIAEAPENELLVSDHAVIRYMERVQGLDLEPVRTRLRELCAGRYDPADDHEVVVTDEAVMVIRGRGEQPMIVTVLSPDGPIPEKGQLSVMKHLRDDEE